MDLIRQYSSSSSSSEDDDDEREKCKRRKKNSQGEEESENIPNIILLHSPTEHKEIFQRTKPHIKGNWSGHVYIRLDGRGENTYGNELMYERLKDHVMDVIRRFHSRLGIAMGGASVTIFADRQYQKQQNCSDIVIMPHLNMGQGRLICNESNNHDKPEKVHRNGGEPSSPQNKPSSEESGSDDSETDDDKEEDSINCLRPLHISLSRPFYMQHQSIESFLSEVRQRVRIQQQQHPLAFCISAKECKILTNDEKTRSFLTVPVRSHATARIQKLVAILDGVLMKFGQRGYYSDPQFHISIASWAYNEKIVTMDLKLDELLRENNDANDFLFSISGIFCLLGNTKEHHLQFG